MGAQLLPCPFCGTTPDRERMGRFETAYHEKEGCPLSLRGGFLASEWNTRSLFWVSVDDRLPEEGAWYLITTTNPDFNKRISTIAFLDSCGDEVIWLSHNDKEDDCSEWKNVTHWMPLPEVPEKRESFPCPF